MRFGSKAASAAFFVSPGFAVANSGTIAPVRSGTARLAAPALGGIHASQFLFHR
jgi:hypothetical protein